MIFHGIGSGIFRLHCYRSKGEQYLICVHLGLSQFIEAKINAAVYEIYYFLKFQKQWNCK